MNDLHEGILETFVEASVWSKEDAFKAMSMHVHWHTSRLDKNQTKQTKYRASLLSDPTKREKRLAAKRAVAKAAYGRKKAML